MQQNFREMYYGLGVGRSVGLFGMAHSQLDSSLHENLGFHEISLGEYLDTEFAPTAGKVLSIKFIYHDSYLSHLGPIVRIDDMQTHLDNMYGYELIDAIAAQVDGMAEILASDEVGMFYLMSSEGIVLDGGSVLSDAAQYLLLIKSSPASINY